MLLTFLIFLIMAVTVWRSFSLRHSLGTGMAIGLSSLRILALFAALSLALPLTIPSIRFVRRPKHLALLVDNSLSVPERTRKKLLRQLKGPLTDYKETVTFWAFGDGLEATSLTTLLNRPRSFSSPLSDALVRLAEMTRPDVLLVITDGQDTGPLPERVVTETFNRLGVTLALVPLPSNLPPNLRLHVNPLRYFVFPGETVTVTVQVTGQNIVHPVPTELQVWEGSFLRRRIPLSLKPQGKTLTQFRVRPKGKGWHRYRLRLVPLPEERWHQDNFVEIGIWKAPTRLRVLLFCGRPDFEFKFAKRAVEEEGVFEWVALTVLPDGARYQIGSPALLPASLTSLDPFHVLVLFDPAPFDFGSIEALRVREFVEEGGGLLLVLGKRSVQGGGWRPFLDASLQVTPLPAPKSLIPIREDFLGEQLPKLPEAEALWSVTARHAEVAVKANGKPVLIWFPSGSGKVIVSGIGGTWRWAMGSAQRGKEPRGHRSFWQTLIRFLADPRRGVEVPPIKLSAPHPPPLEWTTPPNLDPLLRWVQATGGRILSPDELPGWIQRLQGAETIRVTERRPLSDFPLPYLVFLTALTLEWWLIRRRGLI